MAMLLEMGASTILYFKAEASYILQTLTAFVPYHKGTATTTLELVTRVCKNSETIFQ